MNIIKFIPFINGNMYENIIAGIITSIIITLSIYIYSKTKIYLLKTKNVLRLFISRKTAILVWLDEDGNITKKICDNLSKKFDRKHFIPIDQPIDIINFPLHRFYISAIIILVTDVTKLSEDKTKRDTIQNCLVKYITSGGGMIGGHDIIYTRTRNNILEKAFGAKLNKFKRISSKVKYNKNTAYQNHELTQNLPDYFELSDNEICWGDWSPDVLRIFQTPGEDPKPLVVARSYGKGRIVWLNSGDKIDHGPKSIFLPEKEFEVLLKNAIKWVVND